MKRLSHAMDRINVSSIISEHLATFYHYEKLRFYNKKEIPTSDKWLFGAFPIVLAGLLCVSGLAFTKDYVDIVLTCLSIFIGLLFGLLTMVYGLIQENQKIDWEKVDPEEKKQVQAKVDLTIHLFINIAFSVVLSIFALVCVLLTQLHPDTLIALLKKIKYFGLIKRIYIYTTNWVAFALLIEFLLVLMMIIRRFMVLFLNQFNGPNFKKVN